MKAVSFIFFSVLVLTNSFAPHRHQPKIMNNFKPPFMNKVKPLMDKAKPFMDKAKPFMKNLRPPTENLVDISPYDYPKPIEKPGKYNIAIFGTSDIHGAALPMDFENPVTKEAFTRGGVEYIGKYIDILRHEWKDRFIYLDGGDFQQGGYESKITDGKVVTDFFNYQNLAASAMGNHQFEDSEQVLQKRMSYAKYPFVLTNGINKETHSNYLYKGQIPMLVKKVGKALIGILGYTTMESTNRSAKGYPNFTVTKEPSLLIGASHFLRDNLKVDAVVLVAHCGYFCGNKELDLEKLGMYGPDSEELCQPTGELVDFLNSVPNDTFDAVVGGHEHTPNHFFVNGIPVVTPSKSGIDVNVIYLTLDLKNHKVLKDESLIEGPIPVCSKVFKDAKKCTFDNVDMEKEGEMKDFAFHHVKVEKDPKVTEIQKDIIATMDDLKNDIVFETDSDIPQGEGHINMFMGDVYADGMKEETGSDFALINLRGFRLDIPKGKINKLQFKNMYPYGGTIQKAEITGKDMIQLVKTMEEGKKPYYSLAGVKATYDMINNKILSVTMPDGSPIDPEKTYTFATLEYYFNGGDDFGDVLKFYTPKIIQSYEDVNDVMYRRLKEMPVIHKDDYEAAHKVRIEIVEA